MKTIEPLQLPETAEDMLIYKLSHSGDFVKYFCVGLKTIIKIGDNNKCIDVIKWLMTQSVVDVSFSMKSTGVSIKLSHENKTARISIPERHCEWYYDLAFRATEHILNEYDRN